MVVNYSPSCCPNGKFFLSRRSRLICVNRLGYPALDSIEYGCVPAEAAFREEAVNRGGNAFDSPSALGPVHSRRKKRRAFCIFKSKLRSRIWRK